MWKIHGKQYNLELFMDKHPGGRKILEIAKNQPDLTPAFESYHALCDRDKINAIMKKYEVGSCEKSLYTFEEKGFYKTLVKEVRKTWNRQNSKWCFGWLFNSMMTFGFFIYTYLLTFWYTDTNFFIRLASSVTAGTLLIQTAFQIYHDATHYALLTNSVANQTISKFFAGLLLWDWAVWLQHHSLRHHSYTGHKMLDPDVYNKKDHSYVVLISKKITNWYFLPILIMIYSPGIYLGQVLSYMKGLLKRKLWNMDIICQKTMLEYLIITFHIFMMIHGKSWLLFFSFVISMNINYCIAVLPDHDTMETLENSKKKCSDWGESQVLHSANFSNKNMVYTRLYGGINYQIEHHLFPTVCSYHLPKLKKLVVKTCKEFGINYVEIPTILGAYQSALDNLFIPQKEVPKLPPKASFAAKGSLYPICDST